MSTRMHERARAARRTPRGPVTPSAFALASFLMFEMPSPRAESEAADGDLPTLPTIDVRGLVPKDPALVPGATAVLDENDIDTLHPVTMHDAFEFVPGVHAQDDDSFARRSGVGIRGAPSRRSRKVLMLEDGVPINASTYLDSSTHYTPPLERIERVEVLKGAGQILHGPLNNHGIVNFRNAMPTATPTTTAEFSFGDRSIAKQHLMHQRTDGALGSVFSYTHFEGDGVFDVEDTEYHDLYAGFDWRIDDRQKLHASLAVLRERSHYDESNLTPQEYAVAPFRKKGRFGQEFNTIAVNYHKLDFSHDFQVSDTWSSSTKLFLTDLDRPRFTVDPGEYLVGALPDLVLDDGDGHFVPGADGNGQMISRDRHYRTFGLENRMQVVGWTSGAVEHTLQFGARVERHLFLDKRSEGEVGEVLDEGNRGETTRREPYEASAVSAFVQDAMRIGAWTITPGVRAERYTQQRQRTFPTREPREEYDKSIVLPGISVLHEGARDTQWFASVQRGYTPATARESDFPLVPEIGINSQLGVRSTLRDGVSLEAAVFHNRLRDTLVQLPFIDPETGGDVFINAEDSKASGLDLGLRLDTPLGDSSAWKAYGLFAYGYVDAVFTRGITRGNQVPEVPKHTGSLTFGLEHARGWHVSATLTRQGRFFTDPANTRDPILANEDGEPLGPDDVIDLREPIVLGQVPGRTLLSARASWSLPRRPLTLWIQGRNLTDRRYVSDYSNGMRPGVERTLSAGLTLRFH